MAQGCLSVFRLREGPMGVKGFGLGLVHDGIDGRGDSAAFDDDAIELDDGVGA